VKGIFPEYYLGNEIKEREVGVTCMMHGIAQGTQSFQKSRDPFIILSTTMVIEASSTLCIYKYNAPQYKIQFPRMYASPGAERKVYIILIG
jgi:hypothetical protein